MGAFEPHHQIEGYSAESDVLPPRVITATPHAHGELQNPSFSGSCFAGAAVHPLLENGRFARPFRSARLGPGLRRVRVAIH